ncbi:MAG: histidinol-phosphate transaminase, partial [Clostridia bacterium]
MSFLNKKLSHLKAYVPGEQLCDREYIKLNTNESPFPPSPLVAEAITKAELDNLKLYPDPTCRVLCEKAAEVYNIKKENVLFGNGSDEVLSYIFLAFCENGVVFPDISYGFYKVFAELYGIDYEKIPLDSDFKITAEKYFNKNKTIIIANPNAPTGLILSQKEIIEILQSNKNNVVIIDEAYIDFGGKSAIDLICDYKNLIVVQTFSKSRSLAGARLGMAFADEKIINDLIKIKYSTNPYNINRITQLAGC